MKNVLVTGGLGLLGKHLTNFLDKKKFKIFVLDKSKYQRKGLLISKNVYFINGNFQNKQLVKNILKNKKINVVFHLGGSTQVSKSLNNPYKTYKNNVIGTLNLLECIRKINNDILFIYSSTPQNKNYNLYNPYFLSKFCSDFLCASYSKIYNLKTIVVKCVNLYGPGDLNVNRIIPYTILSSLKKKQIKLQSSGKLVTGYIYIDDVVKAYFLIMKKNLNKVGEKHLVYNVGSKYNISVLDLVNLILRLMKKNELKQRAIKQINYKPKQQKLNDSKIKNLGWKQKVSLKKGLIKTIIWYEKVFKF